MPHFLAGTFGALLISFFLTPLPVSAVEAESITLSPATKPYTLDAGAIKRDSFTVINDGNSAYDFIVYTAPYSVKNRTYDPDYTTPTANGDAFTWVQFDTTKWHLEPGGRVDIPFTLRVSADAAPGGHYGVMFAEIQPVVGNAGINLARKKRVGAIIYANISGAVKTEGQLLTTRIDWLQFKAPLSSMISVENTGNVDFKMLETYEVKDLFGGVKYRSKTEHVLLPKTVRDIELKWDKSPWFGLFRVAVDTTILGKTSHTDKLVLVTPKWLLIVSLIAILGGGYAAIKNRNRR